MHEFQTLNSSEDESINVVFSKGSSYLESRYVERFENGKRKVIVYLSSQNGCNQSCRFCHLTQTKQTQFEQGTLTDYLEQANKILTIPKLKTGVIDQLNFNFMARGEPLLNPLIQNNWSLLRSALLNLLIENNIRADKVRFKISTIGPISVENYAEVIDGLAEYPDTDIYYSLYSLHESFRVKWLPKSHAPERFLNALLKHHHENNIILHWAFISGENDDYDTVMGIINLLRQLKTANPHLAEWVPRVNIVRYNPHVKSTCVESDRVFVNADLLRQVANVKVVNRVGHDVKASCGMFV